MNWSHHFKCMKGKGCYTTGEGGYSGVCAEKASGGRRERHSSLLCLPSPPTPPINLYHNLLLHTLVHVLYTHISILQMYISHQSTQSNSCPSYQHYSQHHIPPWHQYHPTIIITITTLTTHISFFFLLLHTIQSPPQ